MQDVLAMGKPIVRTPFRPTSFGVGLALFAALLVLIAAMVTLDPDNNDIVSNVVGLPIRAGASAILFSGIFGFCAVLLYRVSATAGWLVLIATVASALSDNSVEQAFNWFNNQMWSFYSESGVSLTQVGAGLFGLVVSAGGIATVIAALYAADPRRRIGRWVVPVAAVLVLSMVAGAWLMAVVWCDWESLGFPVTYVPPWWFHWWQPLLFGPQVYLLVLLGLLGDLMPGIRRARARRTLEGQRRVPTNLVRALVDELVPGRAAAQTAVAAAERARFASDLHAEVLPHLARTIARSERGASADELTSQLRDLETDLRALMTERRLVILEEFGLVPALEWLAEQTQDRFDVEVALDVEALDEVRPPREVERAAFRIAQLALDNAVRHGAPSAIALSTRCATRQVALSIRDDGIGIAPEAGRTAASRNRAGLADMRVEADRVGGALDVHPARPGTEVTFAWAA